jgi:beta-galactosidase
VENMRPLRFHAKAQRFRKEAKKMSYVPLRLSFAPLREIFFCETSASHVLCRKEPMLKINFFIALIFSICTVNAQRNTVLFNKDWKFFPGDDSLAKGILYNDKSWRTLDLPHDWSIEGSFSESNPATNQGGSLPTGIGWYRKMFSVPTSSKDKLTYIEFDGVQSNSEVWINGHYLGKRPNGYISFRYNITPYLNFGRNNFIAVRVDNSAQPASRWYTGSGIYRKVRLVTTAEIAVDQWGLIVTTRNVNERQATVDVTVNIFDKDRSVQPTRGAITIYDAQGKEVASQVPIHSTKISSFKGSLIVRNPSLWSPETPSLYKVVVTLQGVHETLDKVETNFGIRYFHFDAAKGFFLNGKPTKILGVCQHHDLGALGAAVNTRAIERQLEILKAMGCNAIRTAHNPPATEFLDLCDRMGFIVMDETFDMWKKRKNKQDYHLYFDEWSKRDLEDHIKRDRNHPSVFIWSIGNEIREQFDSSGTRIAKELVAIVKKHDSTRPVTSALTENFPEKNFIYQSGTLDVLGFNYKLEAYADLPKRFPGQKFIATETSSALATRGHYDMPSDSNRLWPPDSRSAFKGNADFTVSAYDHVYAYWGSTHEAGWNAVKKYEHMAGIFVWSGFDFIGEPVPYPWPARSSYYGVIDLAGFPKDAYYLYQSEWTSKPVLHVFPHWNWNAGQIIDIWAFYSQADEVELFLNDKSLGVRKKQGDSMHVLWRVPFTPGTLRAVSRLSGNIVLTKEIKTAGKPAKIELIADRTTINSQGNDLSFITVRILDAAGNLVPGAANLINFDVKGEGYIVGVDNGHQSSMEPFKASYRKAFNGQCLVIIGTKNKKGKIFLEAKSPNLASAIVAIDVN